MALTDLTRISTSGIATGSTIDAPILRKDVSFHGSQVGVVSALFDSSDNALEFNDDVQLKLGNSGDFEIYHRGADGVSIINETGSAYLSIGSNGNKVELYDSVNNRAMAEFFTGGACSFKHGATTRLETTQSGAVVTGVLTATSFSGPILNTSGIATFYDLRVSNNLTVEGTTTTLDTNLIGVDRVNIGANSNTDTAIVGIQSGTADIVNLFDGTTEVLTVKDGGFVGVGTINPGRQLHVLGTTRPLEVGSTNLSNIIKLYNSGTGRATYNGFDIKTSSTSGGGLVFYGGYLDFATSESNGTDGTSRLRILSDGKVGIGTDSPDHNLHVLQNAGDAVVTIESTGNGNDAALEFIRTSSGGDSKGGASIYVTGDTSASEAKMQFGVGHNISHGQLPRMTIMGNGEVGIGTDNVQTLLHLKGTGGNTSGLRLDNSHDNLSAYFQDDNNDSDFLITYGGTGGAELTIHADGNLGLNEANGDDVLIGTSSVIDNSKLTIVKAAAGLTTAIALGNGNGSGTGSKIISTKSLVLSADYDANNAVGMSYLGFETDGVERLRILSDGKVGIGTDTATAKLEITDAIGTTGEEVLLKLQGRATKNVYLDINADANRRGVIRFKSAGTDKWSIGRGDSDEISDDSFFIATGNSGGNTTKLAITSSGNVGIGYTNPGQKIDVSGAVQASQGFRTAGHPILAYASFTDIGSDNYATRVGSTGTSTLRHTQIYGGGSHIATFDGANTRLGINTTTPEASLHITGGLPHIRLENSGTSASANDVFGQIDFKHNDSDDAGVTAAIKCVAEDNAGNSFLAFYNGDGGNADERLRISSTGEMGVGLTQAPPTGSFTIRLTETPELNLYSTQHAQNNNCKINFGVGQSASVSGNTGGRIEMNIPNTGGQMTGDLIFHTNSGDNLQERLRITSDGKIKTDNAPDSDVKFKIDDSIGWWNTNTGLAPNSTRTWTITNLNYGGVRIIIGGADGNYQRAGAVIEAVGNMWATAKTYYHNETIKSSSGASISTTYNNSSIVISVSSSSNWWYYSMTIEHHKRTGQNDISVTVS